MRQRGPMTIVACGTLRRDLETLQEEGRLSSVRLLCTDICLKERPKELERQLREKPEEAIAAGDPVLVLYGTGCFSDSADFSRSIDSIIEDAGVEAARVKEQSCVEMFASEEEKERLAEGQKAHWLMPAWIEARDEVFREWDAGKRNETFPQNDVASIWDSRGFFAALLDESPETILEFSDWMGLPLDAREIGRERFLELIDNCVEQLRRSR